MGRLMSMRRGSNRTRRCRSSLMTPNPNLRILVKLFKFSQEKNQARNPLIPSRKVKNSISNNRRSRIAAAVALQMMPPPSPRPMGRFMQPEIVMATRWDIMAKPRPTSSNKSLISALERVSHQFSTQKLPAYCRQSLYYLLLIEVF